jgi:hypothetical protein
VTTLERKGAIGFSVLLAIACGTAPEAPGSGAGAGPARPEVPSTAAVVPDVAPGTEVSRVELPSPGPYHVALLPGGAGAVSRTGRTLVLDASGTIARELPFGGHVAADAAGNLFVAGELGEDVEQSGLGLVSAGGLDAWVAKLDPELALMWVRQLGSEAQERPRALAADERGGAVMMGTGIGTLALGPDGSTLWQSPLAGSDFSLAPAGNLLVIGGFVDELTIGAESHYSDQPSMFLAELDARGAPIWSRTISGSGPVYGERITTDATGGFVIVGAFRGTVTFGGAPLAWYGTDGQPYTKGFVAAFTADGRHRYSLATEIADPFEIVADGSGNVAFTGASSDAPPYIQLRVLALDGVELFHPGVARERGYGFDVAVRDGGALYFSLEVYEEDDSVLRPYLTELAL